jgi:DNA polymerase III epsilon subunit-like protein
MDSREVSQLQARWYADDPRVTNPLVVSLLASAFTAHPNSPEYEYSVARLSAMGAAEVPLEALVAAFKPGANKFFWMRQLRSRLGRFIRMFGAFRLRVRRKNGKVFNLAGRMVSSDPNSKKVTMELPNGKLVRVPAGEGEAVKALLPSKQASDGYSKTPIRVSSSDSVINEKDLEFVDFPNGWAADTSWTPSQEDKDYYGDKVDLGTMFVDENDNYEVVKFEKANFPAKNRFEMAQQKEAEGNDVVAYGNGKDGELDPNLPVYFVRRKDGKDRDFAAVQSWADVQQIVAEDEALYEKNEPSDPKRPAAIAELKTSDLKVGDIADVEELKGDIVPGDPNASKAKVNAYEKKLAKYKEEGGEFPIDPRREHLLMDDGTIFDTETGEVLRDSQGNTDPGEPAEAAEPAADLPETEDAPVTVPEGYYDVTRSDYFPEGATEGQTSPDYTDDPAQLAQEYSAKDLTTALAQAVKGNKENPATGFGQLSFDDGLEVVPAEALYKALDEQGEDADQILDDIYKGGNGAVAPKVAPEAKASLGEELPQAAQGTPSEQEIPPLIDGLTKDEKDGFLETGDYKKYLPENKIYGDSDVPEGYAGIDNDPWTEIEGDLPEDAPEGFSVNPVDIANNYKNSDLITELRRALEPGNPTPGYGIIGMDTPEGEKYLANVPAEAIRDALQLQGVDTNELIDAIYDEGFQGQGNEEPTPEEIQDALEGENVEEGQEPTAEPEEEDATPAEEQAPTDEEGPPAAPPTDGISTGEPDGPAKLTVKTKDIKPGDISVSDYFTVEEIFSDEESEAIKSGSFWVVGYYPGHATQKTKLWNAETEIDVFRNVAAPSKGDLPELSKPKPKEMDPEGKIYKDKELGVFVPKDAEARSKYLDLLDQYNKDLATAKAVWTDAPEPGSLPSWQTEDVAAPFTPESPVGVTTVKATEVKPGDIAFKKEWGNDFYEYFIVESVEEKDGKAVVRGYYPGHVSQDKEWNATTEITVMRGASNLPEPGKGPALERPKKDDPDYQEKRAAFNAAKKASADSFTPPLDPEAAPTQEKTTPAKPKSPASPAFSGDKLKEIAAEANGDPLKFFELLNQEEIMVLDFETAADGAFNKQTPIQIAWTKFKDGTAFATGTYWMNPEVPLGKWYQDAKPDEVLLDPSGNVISDEWLAKQPSVAEQMQRVFDKISPETIVLAHNMPFDGGILKRYATQLGLEYAPAGEIDTLALARLVINGDNGDHTLQNVAKRYGIVPKGKWHDAETDTEVLYPILEKLLKEMAVTKQGIESLDVDAAFAKYEEDLAAYNASKNKKAIADTSLAVSKPIKDAFDGKENLPTVDELIASVPKELPNSEEGTSATSAPQAELSDNDLEVESILGDTISNNWVEDDENTTDIGPIPVEDWQPGDFFEAPKGGWFEVLEITPDPDDDKRVFVKRRLLANGKEYGENKSWIKYKAYPIRRRNNLVEEPVAAQPETIAPIEDTPTDKWQGYDIKQDSDGVYYADGISASDVQKLRNGELTPPQLPFFAPMGGGNKPDQGDGYFFSKNGKRFWGKFGAAGALVRRKNNKGEYEYFLAKRSPGLSQGGGKWGYPGGAHKDKMDAEENMGIITAIKDRKSTRLNSSHVSL